MSSINYSRDATVTTGYDRSLRNLSNRRICSSLLLQQLLYYQGIFDISWLIFWFSYVAHNNWYRLSIQNADAGTTAMIVIFLFFEPARLFIGYCGNLYENVPYLLLFTILTVVPLYGPGFYLMFGLSNPPPYIQAIQVFQIITMFLETFLGFYAAFRTYAIQKGQFYLFDHFLNKQVKVRH
mmetsp:Transcript_25805/g.47117  ORF Transcript_25805/g.47117 Transcript_25805/m.47117 type:complete len:181 (+) Transcript_25805:146-688(+)